VQDIVRWGRQRKIYWYAQVRRMEEGRLPRIALEGKPIGKRTPGRPPKRRTDPEKLAKLTDRKILNMYL